MTNDSDHPDPNGPKPSGVSDTAWYGYTKVDSSKPISAWTGWDQYADPNAKGYERYKSDKVDANGQPIQGDFEHPDACPGGMTALGHNQCVPVSDPRVQAAWGTGGGTTPQPNAQQTPQVPGFPTPQTPQTQNTMSAQVQPNYSSLSSAWGQTPSQPTGQPQTNPSSMPGFSTPFQQKQPPQNPQGAFGYARQY